MDARPPNPIDACPTETIEAILFSLDGHDVARAAIVCREWRDIVFGSPALQYRKDLALEGFVEDPAHLLPPLADRVASLQRYKLFWNHLLVSIDRVRIFDACTRVSSVRFGASPVGRWLVDIGDPRHPRIAAFPARVSRALLWKDIPLKDPVWDGHLHSTTALQTLDMLIVLSTQLHDDGRPSPKIELLDAFTLSPYSIPEHAVLPWPPIAELELGWQWITLSLCGETLSITFTDGRRTVIVAWTWAIARIILSFPEPVPHLPTGRLSDVVLLAEQAFVWAEHWRNLDDTVTVTLVVMTFDHSGAMRVRGRWAFPALAHDTDLLVELQTDEADEIGPSFRNHAPYMFMNSRVLRMTPQHGTLSTDNILALVLTVAGGDWTFYMLRSTFLQRPAPADPDILVPWEDWGAVSTRCLPGRVQSIHGCRALHSDLGALSMLTFVPEKCRAAAQGFFLDQRDAPNFVNTESVTEGLLFHRPFRTELPYFAARARLGDDGTMSLPHGCSFWCEDGRVSWATDDNPNHLYLATL